MKINLGSPQRDNELELARRMLVGDAPESTLERGDVTAILQPPQIDQLRSDLRYITVRGELTGYIVDFAPPRVYS